MERELEERVLSYMREKHMIEEKQAILAGVSGGYACCFCFVPLRAAWTCGFLWCMWNTESAGRRVWRMPGL